MKLFATLPNLPELEGLDRAERTQLIRQWIREVDRPWAGYLRHIGFLLLVTVPITLLPSILFREITSVRSPDWLFAVTLPIACILANVLYSRFVLPRHRDALHRVLQQRGRAL